MPHVLMGSNSFRMTPLGHQAAALLAQGKKASEIAEYLGIEVSSITYWKQQGAFKEALAEYRQEIVRESMEYTKQQIGALQVKAIDKLDRLLDASSESVQLGAVREILERGPLRVLKQGETAIQPGQVVLTERMIVAMRQVSSLVGDQEMFSMIDPVYQEVTTVGEGGDGSQIISQTSHGENTPPSHPSAQGEVFGEV